LHNQQKTETQICYNNSLINKLFMPMESNCHSLDIHIHHLHQLRWKRRTAVENDIWVGSMCY